LTEQETEKASIDPDLLPPEDREIYLKQLGRKDWTKEEVAMTEGPIKQETEKKTENPAERIRNTAIESWGKWAEQDTYDIEMRDGSTVTYKRVSIPEMELDELEQLRLQVESYEDMDGKPLSQRQQYHMKNLWRNKQAEYYLFNTKTKKMMTPSERLNVKHAFEIAGILTSCQFRSRLEAPEGKN
jgi:hypothetical protein